MFLLIITIPIYYQKSESEFKFEIENLKGNWDFWAFYKGSQMIGYSQNKIINNYCDYSTIKFHPNYLKLYLVIFCFIQ